jgi:uncharacterized protein (TIGR04255 family)
MTPFENAAMPTRLALPPVKEALFEIRFDSPSESVAQILPGMVIMRLGDQYSKTETLPIASLPREIRKRDDNLKYLAQIRILGDGGGVVIGDRVVGLSVLTPYPGWSNFRSRILELLGVLEKSKLLTTIERVSLKYVNLFSLPAGERLSALKMQVDMYGTPAPEGGFHLRTELKDENFIRIVEIGGDAKLTDQNGEESSGLVVNLDCIRPWKQGSLWSSAEQTIDELHGEVRQMFFGLLTAKTLESLKPHYD